MEKTKSPSEIPKQQPREQSSNPAGVSNMYEAPYQARESQLPYPTREMQDLLRGDAQNVGFKPLQEPFEDDEKRIGMLDDEDVFLID